MPRSPAEILKDIGGDKSTTRLRRVTISMDKITPIQQNGLDTKEISRTVMRHPNSETLQQLNYIHQRMSAEFSGMSDEALTWLLGGSSEMARGGFNDSPTQTGAQKFREFLAIDPKTIPPQRLITGIETIATAMGYRAIHASWVVPPFKPETDEQRLMDDKIKLIMGNNLTKPIGEIYSARAKDDTKGKFSPGGMVIGQQEDISTASEVEKVDQKPQKTLDSRTFRRTVLNDHLSWIGAAEQGGIQIRGHTSGTCPLTLAALDGLCSTGTGPRSTWLQEEANLKSLAGVVVMTTFQRGDYHSIAETAAGVNHYLTERAIKKDPTIVNTPMQPYDAFKEGMSMLVAATSTKKASPEDTVSIQEAVAVQSQAIIDRTKRLEAKTQEFDPNAPEKFYDQTAKFRAVKQKNANEKHLYEGDEDDEEDIPVMR